jgi:hypothetical protein
MMLIPLKKRIRGQNYFLAENLPQLMIPPAFKDVLTAILAEHPACNFIRVTDRMTEFSVMRYNDFNLAHPELKETHVYRIVEGAWKRVLSRVYRESSYILHRVELYFSQLDPRRAFHRAITEWEEQRGILAMPGIGIRKNMAKILSQIPKSEIPPALHYLVD